MISSKLVLWKRELESGYLIFYNIWRRLKIQLQILHLWMFLLMYGQNTNQSQILENSLNLINPLVRKGGVHIHWHCRCHLHRFPCHRYLAVEVVVVVVVVHVVVAAVSAVHVAAVAAVAAVLGIVAEIAVTPPTRTTNSQRRKEWNSSQFCAFQHSLSSTTRCQVAMRIQ